MEHEIGLLTQFVDPILRGEKTFEVRKNDRGYQKGDILIMTERYFKESNKSTSPRKIKAEVSYVLASGWGIKAGYVVLGLNNIQEITVDNPS